MILDRLYLAADTLVRRALRLLESMHRGFWLGLLDNHALDRITRSMYVHTSSYRQREYNQSGLQYWEEALVSRHFQGVRRVLVAAAGGGREMIAMARRGVHADGFDPDPEFVASGVRLLRELGLAGELRTCPPGRVPDGLTGYDAAILGWNVYTHIPGRRARSAFLRDMSACLRPGGRIMLSFFPRSDNDLRPRVTWWVGRLVGALRLRREPVELGDDLVGGYFHHFSQAELREELDAVGLDLLEFGEHPQGFAMAALRER